MRSGYGRSTSLHRDLNIVEQLGLQNPSFLANRQRTHTDGLSDSAVHTIGAYLGAAGGLPSLIGACVTSVVLFILEVAEAIGQTLPIEWAAETFDQGRARVV